ncbi:hypothetical protein [Clostridium thermarum]|uniref:hypothetical protein n=1 Tax=Clostridium thermarum TaxID=1716543 RepID=UPI0013CFED2E|nr:hypothetical protein [Clostridium thermarum]
MKKVNVLNLSLKLFYISVIFTIAMFIVLSLVKVKQNVLVEGSITEICNENYFTFYYLGNIDGVSQKGATIELISSEYNISLQGTVDQVNYIDSYKLKEGPISEYIIKFDYIPQDIKLSNNVNFYVSMDSESSLLKIIFMNVLG